MTETQALTLAIEALRMLKQKYAVDANLHDQLWSDSPDGSQCE